MLRHKTSIIVDTSTRDNLKKIGSKEQTYDDIINELLFLKKQRLIDEIDPLDARTANLSSSGSGRI